MSTPTPTPRTDSKITFTGAYTCTHHNDQMRAACPVCLVATLTAERDQLQAEVERLHRAAGIVGEAFEKAAAELTVERARSPGPRLAPQSPTEMRPN